MERPPTKRAKTVGVQKGGVGGGTKIKGTKKKPAKVGLNKEKKKKRLVSIVDDDKPKQDLFEKEEEDSMDLLHWARDGDDHTSDEERLELEEESRKLEQRKQKDEEEAEAEMKEKIKQDEVPFHLPEKVVTKDDISEVSDVPTTNARIHSILEALANFQEMREPGRSRENYIAQLKADVESYYGYSSWLTEKIFSLFSPSEVCLLSQEQRKLIIRSRDNIGN